MICTLCELRNKEVINICDGTRFGYVCDIEIDTCTGNVCSLIIPREKGLFSFSKSEDIRIPWRKIERIGDDTILVNITSASDIEKNICK